jgi:hypothetical protein
MMTRSLHHRWTAAATAAAVLAAVTAVGITTAMATGPTGGIANPLPSGTATAVLDDAPSAACVTAAGCDLYAERGSVTAGASSPIDIWGFSFTSGDGNGKLGGTPDNTIIMKSTDTLKVTLHNNLPASAGPLSLEVPALASATPDTAGAGVGATTTYTFSGLAPGTYIYQAGATVEQERDQAMGLAALIVVRPADYSAANTSAYGDLHGAFSAEALLAVSEIDPSFNADPLNRDVQDYSPQYYFINGKAHPSTDDVAVASGSTLLLRAANLGIRDHSIGLVNARMTLIGNDSHELDDPALVESQLLTPGQVSDLTTVVDPAAPLGSRFPIVEMGRHLNNGNEGGVGGMLTFIDVVSGPPGAGSGPVAKATAVSPATNDGSTGNDESIDVTFTGGPDSAKWFLDKIAGTGHALDSTADGTHVIPIADILGEMPMTGDHIIWVVPYLGTTAGVPSGEVFTLALNGPTFGGLQVDPKFTNLSTSYNKVDPNPPGSTDIKVTGATTPSLVDFTADNAELCEATPTTTCPTAALSVTVGDPLPPSHTQSLAATVPAADLTGFADGPHTLSLRAHEHPNLGEPGTARWSGWGDPASTVDVVIDRTVPTVTVDAAHSVPNPAGAGDHPGNLNFLESTRLQVDISDTLSPIANAEVFLDQPTPDLPASDPHHAPHGTGSQLRPLVGQWLDDLSTDAGTHTKSAFIDIPTSELMARPQGPVHVFVYAQDAAGNWSGAVDHLLTVDKTSPVVQSAGESADPQHELNPDETGAPIVTGGHITVSACDPNGVTADPNCVQPAGVNLLAAPNVPVTSKIAEIRYHVNAGTGTVGLPGAGIFYQNAQRVAVPAGMQADQLANFDFEWHEIKQGALPYDPAISVFVWVVDGAGNPSQPVEVTISS